MKAIKLFILGALVASFIQACNVKSKAEPLERIVINNQRSCYLPFELNPLNTNDTINRMFYDGTKEGHWIVFEYITVNNVQGLESARPPVRVKVEEGNYVNGKKDGLWKFYKKDGTIREKAVFNNGERGC